MAAYVIYNQTEVLDQEALGEPTFADAILDRIVHNGHRIEPDEPKKKQTAAVIVRQWTCQNRRKVLCCELP